MSETPDELRAPVAYLRPFFPCPHWTTVCGMDNGESCPLREACDRIEQAVARREQP
jgi:hypothetical protein